MSKTIELALAALLLAGCQGPELAELEQWRMPSAEDRVEVGPRTRTVLHPETGSLLKRWGEWVTEDGVRLKHGSEERWDPAGTKRVERAFEMGRSAGHWRTWHGDGTLAFEYDFGAPQPAPMVFFHEGGTVSARGLARDGAKVGPWTYWHPSGALESRGEYDDDGRRAGVWEHFDGDGLLAERGAYAKDVRVGPWERFPAGGASSTSPRPADPGSQ